MKKATKVLIVALLVTFLSGSFSSANAQTSTNLIDALQKQIQDLLIQIQSLQNQVIQLKSELGSTPKTDAQPSASTQTSSTGESTTAAASAEAYPEFTRVLVIGASGDDVRRLQEFLAGDKSIYPEGVVTGYFGPMTERAVRRWQIKNGIESVGRIGPKSLVKLNELITVGAGKSSKTPPGLLTATGLQNKTPTSTQAVASTSTVTTSTTPVNTTTSSTATATSSASVTTTSTTPTADQTTTVPTTQTGNTSSNTGTGSASGTTSSTNVSSVTSTLPTPTITSASSSFTYSGAPQVVINWSVSSMSGITGFHIYRSGSLLGSVSPTSTSGGSFTDNTPTTGASYNYTVASYNSSGQTSSQSAPTTVTIQTPTVFNITSPNSGDSLTAGNTHTITWTSTGGTASNVNIELFKGSGAYSVSSVIYNTSNTGNYSWTVPADTTVGSDYKIRISNSVVNGHYGETGNFTINVPLTAPSSPIGFWKFDGNGTNSAPGASTSTDATLVGGGAAYQSSGGKLGGYLYLSGSSDYAKIPYNSIFDLQNLTVEFWFRQRSNQSFNQRLVSKGTPPNNYNFDVSRWLWNEYNSGPIIAGSTAAGTGYWHQASNGNNLAHGEWHHVAYTRSTTNNAYYLDGATTYAGTLSSEYAGAPKMPAVDVIIGNPAPDTDIDNLRIYNYALSRGEVLYNYNSGSGIAGVASVSKQLADISAAAAKIAEEIRKLLGR